MGVVSPKLEEFTFKKSLIMRSQPQHQHYAMELTTHGHPGVEEMPSAKNYFKVRGFGAFPWHKNDIQANTPEKLRWNILRANLERE